MVIKSTIPVGHDKSLQDKHNTDRVIFSPEFLREGQALKDNLYPSRIIVGSQLDAAKVFAESACQRPLKKKTLRPYLWDQQKLRQSSFLLILILAMRVSFFNELDSYALAYGLDTKSIINGVCLDERIGQGIIIHPLVMVVIVYPKIRSNF